VVGKPLRKGPKEVDNGVLAHTKSTYIPPTRPYEISDLVRDLAGMAKYLLRPGGRLVFFLPTVSEDYAELDLPTCEGMRLVGNSVQDFGNWARRLITMEKSTEIDAAVEPPTFEDRAWKNKDREAQASASGGSVQRELMADEKEVHVPAHHGFRDKYI